MAALTGNPDVQVNHSIITGEVPAAAEPNPSLNTEANPQGAQVKTKLDSDREAMIARSAAKAQREREELKKERESFKAEQEQARELIRKANAFEEKRKAKDYFGAFSEVGLSETEIFNLIAESATPKAEPTVADLARQIAQEEVGKLKTEQLTAAQEAEKVRFQGLITQFKTNIKSEIDKQKETYEYVAFNGPMAEELVFDTVSKVLEDTGELIDVKEALALVEGYYEEQDKAMSVLKKRQPKEVVPRETKEPERTRTLAGQPGLQTPNTAPKTLTHKVAPTSGSAIRRETGEQKKQRLIAALKNGKL